MQCPPRLVLADGGQLLRAGAEVVGCEVGLGYATSWRLGHLRKRGNQGHSFPIEFSLDMSLLHTSIPLTVEHIIALCIRGARLVGGERTGTLL